MIVTASGTTQTETTIPYEVLPNSLSVTTPNVDLSKIQDNRPLFDAQKDLLTAKGYSIKEIDLMTIEDFNNVKKTWRLARETIEAAQKIYPQLETVDMTDWTHEEFQNYFMKVDAITYAPNADQAKRFAERNITLADARYLLKEFHSYDTILAQSDALLKDILEKRNQFNLDFANYVSQIGSSGVTINATPPPEHIDKYVEIYMPGYAYQPDFFHVNSYSWDPDEATWQSNKTKAAFRVIYNVSLSVPPYITNMWGTYSSSSNGAHEGIDIAYGQTPPVYSIAKGQVRSTSTDIGRVEIYDNTVTYNTLFYNHLSQILVSNPVNYFGRIGNQGDVGAKKGQYHVHIQVEHGIDPIQHSATNNHNLDSANPYIFIHNNGW